MKLTFRWYGKDDPVTLEKISQIPTMTGIVSAVYDSINKLRCTLKKSDPPQLSI